MENRFSGYLLGHRLYMWLSREWNQRQKHKKQPWSNVVSPRERVALVMGCG